MPATHTHTHTHIDHGYSCLYIAANQNQTPIEGLKITIMIALSRQNYLQLSRTFSIVCLSNNNIAIFLLVGVSSRERGREEERKRGEERGRENERPNGRVLNREKRRVCDFAHSCSSSSSFSFSCPISRPPRTEAKAHFAFHVHFINVIFARQLCRALLLV